MRKLAICVHSRASFRIYVSAYGNFCAPQPLHPAHLPAQILASGHPTHLTPFFFSLRMYMTTAVMITATKRMIRISVMVYLLRAYSLDRFLSDFMHRYPITATIAATAIRPGKKPAPRAPVVIRVPIWYTRYATVKPVAN